MQDLTFPPDVAIDSSTLSEMIDAVVAAVVSSTPHAALLPASEMRQIARHGAEVSAALPPARRPLGIAASARDELSRALMAHNGVVVPPAM
jgi:hypothetical protein